MFSATTTYACMLLLVGMPGAVHGWADIAGAPTFKCMHHLFHGCPAFGGWHHAGSVDLVHWDDRGVPIKVLAEAWNRRFARGSSADRQNLMSSRFRPKQILHLA